MDKEPNPDWLYADTVGQFAIDSSNTNKVHGWMCDAAKELDCKPREVQSWRTTIERLRKLLKNEDVYGLEISDESQIVLEYRFENRMRIDAILCGRNQQDNPSAYLLEMKNWRKESSAIVSSDDPWSVGVSFNGSEPEDHEHFCTQLFGYYQRLRHRQKVCYDDFDVLQLDGSVYMPLIDFMPSAWKDVLGDKSASSYASYQAFGVYDRDKDHKLLERIVSHVGNGTGAETREVLSEIRKTPSKVDSE